MASDESKYHLLSHEDDESDGSPLETKRGGYGKPTTPSSCVNCRNQWFWRGLGALLVLACTSASFFWGLNAGKKLSAKSAETPYCKFNLGRLLPEEKDTHVDLTKN